MARSPIPISPRAVCGRCRRPTSVCYCAALTTLDTVTRVVILQHPRERRMPIGTARMASLCLPRASLHVGARWDESPELRLALSDRDRPPILLYPGPGARDILRDPPVGPVTLVVVDGTWSNAKVMVRDNAVLAALPRYAFTAPEPTHYRIRREPRAEYVSTIEALMHVLGALEGDPARFRALLEPMHAMIDAHLAEQARHARRPRPHRQRPHLPAAKRLPSAIGERFDDLVCVVGEANAWPSASAESALGHELIRWVARRVRTGETFDVVALPQNAFAPRTAFLTGLDEGRLRSGVACADLVAAFARFARPTDVICAWGEYGPRLYAENHGVLPDERIDVRAVARRLDGGKIGSFEDYAARIAAAPAAESATSVPLPAGRAGRRVGMLVRIIEAWRALATR